MSETPQDGIAYIAAGATTGAVTAINVGNVGLVGFWSGVAIGTTPIIGAGAIAGAAVYGAVQGFSQADPVALGAIGLGALGGATVSTTIGGVGLAGSFGAVGLGMGAMATLGGVMGLGIYGAAKILDKGIKETPAQAFARMEDKILWQEAYVAALIELDDFLMGNDIKRKFIALEVEDELDRLKAELKRQATAKTAIAEIQPATVPDTSALALLSSIESTALSQNVWFCTHTLKHYVGTTHSIAISSDNRTAIMGGDDCNIHAFDIETGNRLFTLFGREPVLSVAISPNGQTFVSGGLDQVISNWKLNPRMLLNSLLKPGTPHSHSSFVYSLAFTPDGKTVVSGSADYTLRVWNYDHRTFVEKLRRTLNGHTDTVFSVAVSLDGRTIVSGSADRTIRVWDLLSWADPLVLQGHTGWVNSVVLSPDGQTIASGSNDTTIRLWDVKTGKLLAILAGHSAPVTSVLFSPKGSVIISSGQDGTIRFWRYQPNQQWESYRILPGCAPIAISPDGNTLISADQN
ncbi:MAG TPA: hypothetical protein V6C65_22585, partial [Allocoleopsis sp.]